MTKNEKLFEEYKQPYINAYKLANNTKITIEYNKGWVVNKWSGTQVRVNQLPAMTENLINRAKKEKNKIKQPPTYNIDIKPKLIKDENTLFKEKYILKIKNIIIATLYKKKDTEYIVIPNNMETVYSYQPVIYKTKNDALNVLYKLLDDFINSISN